jgi:putative transposase
MAAGSPPSSNATTAAAVINPPTTAMSSAFARATPAVGDLAIMRRMDELHLEFPFAGSRMLRDLLNAEGVEIGPSARRHADEAYGHRSDLSQTEHEQTDAGTQYPPVSAAQDAGHPAKPSLGHGYNIHPDGTWFRLFRRRGSRRVLSHRVSVTMEADFCIEALEEALARHGRRRTSLRIRAASSPARSSRMFFSKPTSPLAWMARAPGATMSSSSGFGDPSNTRRCIPRPMRRWQRPAPDRPLHLLLYYPKPHSSLDRKTPDQAYFNRLLHMAVA